MTTHKKRLYRMRMAIATGAIEESGLTWAQACHAAAAYGSAVKAPMTVTIEPIEAAGKAVR